MNQNNPRFQAGLQKVLATLTSKTFDDRVPQYAPISDELDQMLWLFLEDELPPTDEDRFWQLLQDEPRLIPHLKAMLLQFEADEAHDLDQLPSGVLNRLRASRTASPVVSVMSELMRAVEFSLQITDDFFCVLAGTPSTPLLGIARSPGESLTTITRQFLKKIGIVELTIDHAGNQQCHVSVAVTEPSTLFPVASLTVSVQLLESKSQFDSQPLRTDGSQRFRNLPTGTYACIFSQERVEIDRIVFAIHPSEMEP